MPFYTGSLKSRSYATPTTTTSVRRGPNGQVLNVGDTWTYGGKTYKLTGPNTTTLVDGPEIKQQNQYKDAVAAFQTAQDEAKEANEQRYSDIFGRYEKRQSDLVAGYEKRANDALAQLDGMGAQEQRDISELYNDKYNSARQDMVSRGLSGTTVPATVRMGYAREEANDQGRLQERLRRERIGYQTDLTGDTLNAVGDTETMRFMERRTDAYPDMNQFYSLLGQYGQAQGSSGGGGGSGRSYTTVTRGPTISTGSSKRQTVQPTSARSYDSGSAQSRSYSSSPSSGGSGASLESIYNQMLRDNPGWSTQKARTNALERIARLYGKNSKEYADAQRQAGSLASKNASSPEVRKFNADRHKRTIDEYRKSYDAVWSGSAIAGSGNFTGRKGYAGAYLPWQPDNELQKWNTGR